MKIALAQLNYIVGDFEYNANLIIDHITKAKNDKVELIVFSEMSVCGYMPHDLLEQHDFIVKCETYLHKIAKSCTKITAIVGSPVVNTAPKGKKLFNAACILSQGKWQKSVHKTLLPTYDIFDEYRYFEPNDIFELVEIKGKKIALTICEDLWDKQPSAYVGAKGALYKRSPMEELAVHNPDYILNIAASPYSYNQGNVRQIVLKENANRYKIPVIYVNQTGANTEIIFDGDSMVLNKHGHIIHRLNRFKSDFKIINTQDFDKEEMLPIDTNTDYIEEIHNALIVGIRDYFEKMHFKTATLGLSGGIDSAVVLALAERAIGSQNLQVLLMPSKYSSDHSIKDAVALAEKLGVKYSTIGIQPVVDALELSMSDVFKETQPDVTEENIQARTRGIMLMALSNKFGNILLNTSNKSEAAVGYSTLYGDMNGGLSILGDVYKTDVFKLARFINKDEEIIPENTISKPPSAELRPDQKDSDSLPEYDMLDAILFQYIEQKLSASEIIAQGFDAEVVNKVLRLVNINEYKRFQSPPILRISSKAFGFGRKMPLVAKY